MFKLFYISCLRINADALFYFVALIVKNYFEKIKKYCYLWRNSTNTMIIGLLLIRD